MVAKKSKERINKNPFDFILLMTVLVLLALGITMVLSASSPSSLSKTGNSYTYVKKQVIAAIIGIIGMLIISKIDYRRYEKWYKIIYIVSVGVLLLVLVPYLGRSVNGARRWINVPIIGSIQPSEITKIGLIVWLAAFLDKSRDDIKKFTKGFLIPLSLVAIPVLILLAVQSHLSASIVIILVCSVMIIVAGAKIRYFVIATPILGSLGAGGLYILAKYFNKGRI